MNRTITINQNSRIFLAADQWEFGAADDFSIKAGLVTAGHIRNAANEETRMRIPWETLLDAFERGLFNNLACFVDHEGVFSRDHMSRMAGTWRQAEAEAADEQIVATLRFYSNEAAQDAAEIFKSIAWEVAAGEEPPDVGVSLDCFAEFESQDNAFVMTYLHHVRSADLVFMPGSPGSRVHHGVFDASFSFEEATMPQLLTEPQEEADAPEQDEQLLTERGELQTTMLDTSTADEMMREIIQQGAEQLIQMAGLPQLVTETLLQRHYRSREAVLTAIDEARNIGAAYIEDNVVQMGDGHGRRPEFSMRVPMDDAQDIMDYMFGVDDAPIPEPSMRNLRNFYIALTGDGSFYGVFQADHAQFASATTTSLPNLAKNAMNKVILQMWEGAALAPYRWYEIIVKLKPNDGSIHDMELITYGGTGELPVVAEGGTYTEGSVADAAEQGSFAKRGRYVGVTLELFKNSDIQRLQLVPRALAKDAVRTRSKKVAELFTQSAGVGPTLSDGNPWFHTSGGNIDTVALDKAGWKAARIAIYNHQEIGSGAKIGIWPKYALIPGDLFDDTLELFGYGEGQPTTYEVYSQGRSRTDPRPIPINVPDWTDANDWAAMVDPELWETVCMSYTNDTSGRSHPMPELFTVMSETSGLMFTNDTMPVKVRDWWMLGVTGRQGVAKRNVT
ncbi:MAG: hypothetical protein KDE51_04515 [Anaerolineales bacterium]|nr:hypothetical protein [Anaerolineales bacterium]